MALINNIQALNEAIKMAMAKDETIVLYGEDSGYEGGVFRATEGIQKKFGEKRCFDAQIAEATLVGSGIGMAINGMRPIVEMQFSGFSLPAIQQLFTHLARMRNRSRGRFAAPMIIRMPMGGSVKALEHHSEAMEAIFAHIPGLKVLLPSTPYDTKGLMLAAVKSEDPIIFFEPKKSYRAFKQEVPTNWFKVEIGKAALVKEGSHLTIVTYGNQVQTCLEAIENIEASYPGYSIELIDLRTIKPWDRELVIESVKKTGRLLVVHEAVKSFSVSAEIIATVSEQCFEYLQVPPQRLTGYDVVIPYAIGENYFIISPKKVETKIISLLSYLV